MKWLYVILGVAMLASVSVMSAFQSTGNEWRVCPAGCEFTSIQAAVDAAEDGETIRVEAGTYRENVEIYQPLRLIGSPDKEGGPRLESRDSASSALTVERTKGVLIAELTVAGTGEKPQAISIMDASTTLRDSHVHGSIRVISFHGEIMIEGIELSSPHLGVMTLGDKPSHVTIRDSRFQGAGTAFVVAGRSQVELTRNTVTRNFDAVTVGAEAHAVLRENRIVENYSGGIWLSQRAVVDLIDNRIRSNEWGIALRQPPCFEGDTPTRPFEGEISGADNQFRNNRSGNVCPESFDWPELGQAQH